jgi:hypothetical protein
MSLIDTADRHPSTQQIARWFDYGHLPEGSAARKASATCSLAAGKMIENLPDSPELVAGLRKLLEAKDCFVRASIAAAEAP